MLLKQYFSAFLSLHGALFRGPERCPPLATLPFRAAMRMRFNDQGADGGMWLERQPEAAGLAAPLRESSWCSSETQGQPQTQRQLPRIVAAHVSAL